MTKNKGFRFKTRRARRADVKPQTIPRERQPEEVIGLVQGRTPDSRQEYWFAQWLERKKFQYKFQYRVFGRIKHFYDIDFVVYTAPLWTMIELNGGFWHYGELGQDDRKRQIEIEDLMRDQAKIPIEFLWAEDMISRETVEAAGERIL